MSDTCVIRLASENAFFPPFFLIDPAVEMNESLGESANKKGRQRRLILSVQSHHRTWECYGRPTEELTWFDQQRAQDSSNTELIK